MLFFEKSTSPIPNLVVQMKHVIMVALSYMVSKNLEAQLQPLVQVVHILCCLVDIWIL